MSEPLLPGQNARTERPESDQWINVIKRIKRTNRVEGDSIVNKVKEWSLRQRETRDGGNGSINFHLCLDL